MSSPVSDAVSTPLRALVLAAQPGATLSSLGAAFDDLVLGDLDHVQQDLVGLGPDSIVVLAGPVADDTVREVVGHVVTTRGSRLAVGVSADQASVGSRHLEGLRILGDGCLGDLPVTWWAASDAPEDLGPPVGLGPGGLAAEGAETGFAAHAQLLRARRDLDPPAGGREPRAAAAAAESTGPSLPSAPEAADTDASVQPVPAQSVRRSAPRLDRRLPIVLLLVAVGATVGALASQLGGDRGVWVVLLVVLGVTVLALAWTARALRALTAEIGELKARTRRLDGKIDRITGKLGKRVTAGTERTTRSVARIRQLESRLADLSATVLDLERSIARAEERKDQG